VKNDEEEMIINQTNLPEIASEDNNDINNQGNNGPKLFSRNPNKVNNIIKKDEDEEEDLEKEDSDNKEYFHQNDTEEELDKDDSNINRSSSEKSREIQNFDVEIY